MKRTMIKTFHTHEECYFGELKRSGNPRSEFHTVAKPYKNEIIDTKIADNLIEKITV